MKLASLKAGGRDGTLLVVSRDLTRAVAVPEIAGTLQHALDDWADCAPRLAARCDALNAGHAEDALDFAAALGEGAVHAPLPRAYQWVDGSAYVTHVELARRARGAEMPSSFWTEPLMYQGGSDSFLGPRDPIVAVDESHGIDFEAELAVIVDDVPMGICCERAGAHIKLLMLANDVSLRGLIPAELAKGFGFLQGKPSTAFSPVAVSLDELNGAWDGAKVHLPLLTYLNDAQHGRPDAGQDMTFDFTQLIAHAAATRRLCAGTIIGSGTVANRDPSVGASCLLETRMRETLADGEPSTPFLQLGDRVRIEMVDRAGASIFGAIKNKVVALAAA
ncbi:MAG: fumarylacetoacetate hydrolase family protein [Alphaproteobacteria bacterium]|nr:fumarylacetoacetate hydrolase family protein [Alphaproteobacteria bacterium]